MIHGNAHTLFNYNLCQKIKDHEDDVPFVENTAVIPVPSQSSWICNDMYIKQWDVIIYPLHNFNRGLENSRWN